MLLGARAAAGQNIAPDTTGTMARTPHVIDLFLGPCDPRIPKLVGWVDNGVFSFHLSPSLMTFLPPS